MFDQLKTSIKGMDISDEVKSKIDKLITNVETSTNGRFEDVQNSRDEEKTKRNEADNRLKSVVDKFELKKDFTIEDLNSKIESMSPNADVEQIKADYEARYTADTKELQTQVSDYKSKFENSETEKSDFVYTHTIQASKLFNDTFVEDSMARNGFTQQIKEQTIQQDGKLFAKDPRTGDVLKDINNNNEPLGLDYVIGQVSKGVNGMYLKGQAQGNGGGMPPNQSNGGGGDKKTLTQLHAENSAKAGYN